MRTKSHKRKGGFQMTMGLLLIAAALLLTLQNIREQKQADADAAAALSQMMTAMPQEEAAPQTLVMADEQGNPLDWPLDAQGDPIPWPVEDGAPVSSVTDGEGRTVYWAQLRGATEQAESTAEPAVTEMTERPLPDSALETAALPDEEPTGEPAQDGGPDEADAAQTDALSGWTLDAQGGL
ncbi:MAG: hypothetical protein ACI4MP_02015, partial [Candidatus Ventricola sp.]